MKKMFFKGLIVYDPLKNEPDYKSFNFLSEIGVVSNPYIITLPNDPNSDPFEWAEICKKKFETESVNSNSVAILIPGNLFDLKGNRQGRGGGWYDKFLSAVPRKWIRVGIAKATQISNVPLNPNPWDQKIDYLVDSQKQTIIKIPEDS